MSVTDNTDAGNANGDAGGKPPADANTNADDSKPTGKTFSQEDVDRIVQGRLSKFADYKDLKTKAEEFDKLKDADKPEIERLVGERDQWKQKAEQTETRVNKAFKRAAVIEAASTNGAIDPDAVFQLVNLEALEVDEDGNVTGAKEAVTELLKSKPYLKGTKTQRMGDANGGVQSEGSTPTQFKRSDIADPEYFQKHKAEIMKAYKENRIIDE